jgi:hypothetical protein
VIGVTKRPLIQIEDVMIIDIEANTIETNSKPPILPQIKYLKETLGPYYERLRTLVRSEEV